MPPKKRDPQATTTGSNQRDVNAIYAKSRARALSKLGTYLTQEEKEDLAISGEAFTLTNLSNANGKYGSKWAYTIKFANGEEFMFSLPDNAFRAEINPDLMLALPLPDMRLTRNATVKGEPYDVVPVGFDPLAEPVDEPE